jgi:hypothetical protein
MKSFCFPIAVVTLMLTLLLTLAVSTAGASTAKKPTPPPPVDKRILIKAVDATAATVEIQYMRDKGFHTYKIDSLTTVTVNKNPGKFADIKVGMQVRDYVERDDQTLDSISVDKADPAPAVPKKK